MTLKERSDWVDWGDMPVGSIARHVPLEKCLVCGRSGEPHLEGSLNSPSPDRPADLWVHGGVYYDHDPYAWFFGKRDPSEWAQFLAIREEHALSRRDT